MSRIKWPLVLLGLMMFLTTTPLWAQEDNTAPEAQPMTLERLDALIRTGRATAGEFNNLAWLDLCEGVKISATTLEHAQQAVLMDDYLNPASLHTLATVYAELGRVAEARDVLMQLLENRTTGELESPDWYVLGRMAEEYGVAEAAQDAYKRVEPPDDGTGLATSTWSMAQRRLEGLKGSAD